MSFSSDTKAELCEVIPEEDNLLHALAYGLLLFSKDFSDRKISIKSANKSVIDLYANYLAMYYSSIVDVLQSNNDNKSILYTLEIPNLQDRIKILNNFGYTGKEINLRLNHANLEDENCYSTFLRGAFLSCGYIKNPQKGYQLEFRTTHEKLAYDLKKFIMDIDMLYIEPKVVSRNGSYYVYIKNFEQISNVLAYIGANNATMQFIQAKMIKEIRSNVNRTTNFETANISKTAGAAAKQIVAIKNIMEKKTLDFLDDDLKELAQLRLENPQMSLNELAKQFSEPISRSGVDRRLKKLVDISNNI